MNTEVAQHESTELTGAIVTAPSTELTIAAGQTEFSDAQVAALQQLGVEDASPGDLQVFFHQAKRTGLDPFAKQIYMIGRRTKVKEWNPQTRKQEEKWVMKWTIQIGIDGYRLGGRRVANALGIKLEKDGPYWHDGEKWVDVWIDSSRPPAAAKFTIMRDGEKHTATANYAEYVQTYTVEANARPNSMWSKMPANQLAKCAEAASYRQAFPEQFSGVIFEDAAHLVVDAAIVEQAKTKAAPVRGVAGVRAALGIAQDADPQRNDAPADDPDPEPEPAKVDADNIFDALAAAETIEDLKAVVPKDILDRLTDDDRQVAKGIYEARKAELEATK